MTFAEWCLTTSALFLATLGGVWVYALLQDYRVRRQIRDAAQQRKRQFEAYMDTLDVRTPSAEEDPDVD